MTHGSGALGQVQGDAIRNIKGRFDNASMASAAWEAFTPEPRVGQTAPLGGNTSADYFDFNAANVVPTATENRPINMAVRYLIRARP